MTINIMAKGEKRAEILIYGRIGDSLFDDGQVTAKNVQKQLADLGEVKDIDVFISSPGGNVWDSIAIANMLSNHPARVHAHVQSLAASGASLIAVSADEVTMERGSKMMIHSAHGFYEGNAEEMREYADVLDSVDASQIEIYAAKTDLTTDELSAMLKETTWMSAKEAVEKGFADNASDEKIEASTPYTGAQIKTQEEWLAAMSLFQHKPASPIAAPIQAHHKQSANAGAATEEPAMPKPAPAPAQPADDAAIAAAAEQAKTEERQRVSDITALCGKFEMSAEFTAKAIKDDLSIEKVNALILDEKYQSTEGGHHGHVEVTEDEHDKIRANASEWLVARAGRGEVKDDNPFRGMTIENIAREVLEVNGTRTRGMGREAVIKAAITHSTSDFPNIFENALHKTMLKSFELAKPAWPRFCRVTSLSDFRPHLRYRMGSFSDLTTVLQNGEYKDGTIGDAERESITAVSKGRILNVSREMLINDDMSAFSGAASALGQAAARTLDKDVFNLFTLNSSTGPTMGDGVVLFHADHSNIAASGVPPTMAGVEAARVQMASQQDPDSNDYLDIRPAIWLGPLSLGGQARQTNEAMYDDEATKNQQRPNISRGLFRDIIDTPRLPATVWYALADPNVEPVFEVGFVNGVQVPQLEMQEAFRSAGISWRVTYDYGVGAVGWRGIVKNPGT